MAHLEITTKNPTPPPKWLRNAIIYEINPRTFTSPDGEGDGSGSGTFLSTIEKLDYLQELGINTVWLAGFTEGSSHFSGFWTVYAMRNPQNAESGLGTEETLIELISEVHKRGIRIIGEVVTHGVTYDSPLLAEHPGWFSGGEWGMADFNYADAEFREWWIKLWVETTFNYGFDGYRLDGPNGVSPSEDVMGIWDDIAWECSKRGHEIAVIGENSRYHVRQCDRDDFSHDMAGDFSREPQYATMQISCHDEGINMGPGNYYALRGSRFKFGYSAVFGCNIPLFMAGEEFDSGVHFVSLLKKKIYEGFEESREIEFYDSNTDTEAGGWLLGNRILWDEAKENGHLEMLEDCRKILKIRNENSDILHYDRNETNILPVKCIPKSGSIPYIRYIEGQSAILVIGNEGMAGRDFIVQVPIEKLGFEKTSSFRVLDLWSGEIRAVEGRYMGCLRVSVPGDYKAGGGVRAYRIERAG